MIYISIYFSEGYIILKLFFAKSNKAVYFGELVLFTFIFLPIEENKFYLKMKILYYVKDEGKDFETMA